MFLEMVHLRVLFFFGTQIGLWYIIIWLVGFYTWNFTSCPHNWVHSHVNWDQSSRKKKLLESKAQSNAFGCIQPTPLPSTLLLFTVTCESWLSNTLISVGMLIRVLVKYFYILLETKVSVRQKNSRHKPMAYFSSTVKFQHNKPISPVPQSL